MAFAEVAAAAYDESRPACRVSRPGLEFSGTYTLPANPYAFGAPCRGRRGRPRQRRRCTILRYVAVHDCGRIINPKLVEGQMYGGIAQGIGQALTEGIVYTPEGQPLTGQHCWTMPSPRQPRYPPLTARNHGNSLADQSPGRERHRRVANGGRAGGPGQCRDGRALQRRRAPSRHAADRREDSACSARQSWGVGGSTEPSRALANGGYVQVQDVAARRNAAETAPEEQSLTPCGVHATMPVDYSRARLALSTNRRHVGADGCQSMSGGIVDPIIPGFSDASFQRAFMYISGPYPMKVFILNRL